MASSRRVLCVTSNFPRWKGDSTTPFVLNLACDLAKLGWKVDVLAPHASGIARREVIDGLEIYRFRYFWPESLQRLCYGGGALVNLRMDPRLWALVPALLGAEVAAIAYRLQRERYDLIHAHWILPQGIAATLPARLKGVPYVVTVHGSDVLSLQGRHLAWWKRLALRHAEAVTVNSSYTGRAVDAIAADASDHEQIPMGVDPTPQSPEFIQSIRQKYRNEEGPLLVFVGRLVYEKGVDDLLVATNMLRKEFPLLRCIIVGDGQQKDDYIALAGELGLDGHVKFLGWVQPEEVTGYIAAADCFVGPSKRAHDGCMEAQGLTFVEAMVAGTPVVAARSGGIVDSVRHEETGLLVNESAPAEIAAAVKRIVTDPALAADLAQRARKFAVENFSRELSARKFDRLFQSCIESQRPGRDRSP